MSRLMNFRRAIFGQFVRARWPADALFGCLLVAATSFANPIDNRISDTGDALNRHAPEGVTQLPTLMGSVPADGAVDVPIDSPIVLHFERHPAVPVIGNEAFTLIGPNGPVSVDVNRAKIPDVSVQPSEDLLPGSRYTLFLSSPAASTNRAHALISLTFTTAALNHLPDTSGRAGDEQGGSIHVATGDVGANDESCDSTQTLRGYHFCHDSGSIADGIFHPGFNNTAGRWRTNIPLPSLPTVADFPAGTFPAQASSVFGVMRRIDDEPLAGVSVTLGNRTTRTDALGRFALTNVSAGHGSLFVDGSSANHGDEVYGQFEVGIDIKADEINAVPFTMFVPRITARDTVSVSSPTIGDTVITHPDIPGFELRIPAGAVFRDSRGKIITTLSVVPMPVDRSPIPVPENFMVYVSVQPGGARIEGLNAATATGVQTVYPNYAGDQPPGNGLWYYDASGEGWTRYGGSEVSADKKTIVPSSHWGAVRFMPEGGPSTVGGAAKPPMTCHGHGTQLGDPVDCSTGNFVHQRTDLEVSDTPPLSFTRTYVSGDTVGRSFGRGMTNGYGMYLFSPRGSCDSSGLGTELDLVTADGVYPFSSANAPNAYNSFGAPLTHMGTPSRFYGATLLELEAEEGFTVQLTDGTTYTFSGQSCPSTLSSISDRFGNKIFLTYNAGLLNQVSSAGGRTLSFTYNANNQISRVMDNSGRTVSYAYTGNNLTTVTYPDNTTEKYTYDTNGNMLTVVDRRTNTMVTNQYDSNNRVFLQTYPDSTSYHFAYTLAGNVVTATDVTDTRGNVKHLTFDAAGYPLTITKASGTALAQTTTYVRGQNELVTSMSDALSRVTMTAYNGAGDTVTKTSLYGTANAVTYSYTYTPDFHQVTTIQDPLGHTTIYGYTNGCLTAITDALAHTSSIICDSDGRPLSISDPLTHVTTIGYLGMDLRSVTDALGRVTTLNADNLGRPFAVQDALNRETRSVFDSNDRVAQSFDPLNQQTTYTYDGNGNLTDVVDPNTGHTHYGYDTRNRRTSRTDALNQSESWTYDGEGNVLTYTDRKNQVTHYQYDALNRPSLITFADGSIITPTFDAGNRLTSIVDSVSGTINRSYDGLDRLTQEQTPQGTVNYTYDAANRRATMTPASQTQIVYTFDNADRLTNITQGSQSVTIGYDNANRRTSLTLPNGVVTSYGYDNADELTGLTYKTSGGTTLGSIAYTYDAAGQRLTGSSGFGSDLLPTPSTGTNTFDLNNRETVWNGFALGYDLNGDPTSNAATSPATSYTFDARHRLTKIMQGRTTVGSFAYDSLGRRSSKSIGSITTSFLYDGLNAVQETQGGTNSAILSGLGIDERYARVETAGTRYFLTDALQSTVALTDGTQAIQQTYSYEPYGELSASGSSSNPYQYTGRENDGTGLYFYRARYFSPSLKRFISEDPTGLAAGLNSYSYVTGSPANGNDPMGLESPQYSLQFQYDPTVHNPCVDMVAMQFFLNEIPFVGTAIDLVQLAGSDPNAGNAFGSMEGTLDVGVVDPLEASIGSTKSQLAKLRARQMYNKKQADLIREMDAKLAAKQGAKALVHAAGFLSLLWNIEQAKEGMDQCPCDG